MAPPRRESAKRQQIEELVGFTLGGAFAFKREACQPGAWFSSACLWSSAHLAKTCHAQDILNSLVARTHLDPSNWKAKRAFQLVGAHTKLTRSLQTNGEHAGPSTNTRTRYGILGATMRYH